MNEVKDTTPLSSTTPTETVECEVSLNVFIVPILECFENSPLLFFSYSYFDDWLSPYIIIFVIQETPHSDATSENDIGSEKVL